MIQINFKTLILYKFFYIATNLFKFEFKIKYLNFFIYKIKINNKFFKIKFDYKIIKFKFNSQISNHYSIAYSNDLYESPKIV